MMNRIEELNLDNKIRTVAKEIFDILIKQLLLVNLDRR